MKGNTVLQWFIVIVWLAFFAIGVIAEVCTFCEIFIDAHAAAELLLWTALYNVPFLAGLMAVITVIRRDHSIQVAPESALVYAIGFFAQIVGAMGLQRGELDQMGAAILTWWAILAQYGSFLWMLAGPRVLRWGSGLLSR